MKNFNFSIGILSWKGYASLYNSLKSYEENGLNSLTQSKFICLPEYNNEGIKICKNFGYKPILFKKNIGILNAEVTMRADTSIALDQETGEKLLRILDFLEDVDDVQEVHSNAEFPDNFEPGD